MMHVKNKNNYFLICSRERIPLWVTTESKFRFYLLSCLDQWNGPINKAKVSLPGNRSERVLKLPIPEAELPAGRSGRGARLAVADPLLCLAPSLLRASQSEPRSGCCRDRGTPQPRSSAWTEPKIADFLSILFWRL